jgi:hypothetical protein
MNKHIDCLCSRLPGVERREHNLKKNPSKAQMQTLEMKEHGLKKKPGIGDMIRMEQKEHMRDGQIVIGKGKEKR